MPSATSPIDSLMDGMRRICNPPAAPHHRPTAPHNDDDSGGPGLWTEEELRRREEERQERCIFIANQAHIELIHALPGDICPTLETVLQYAEYVSLGDWRLLEVDQHFYERIVENFLVSGGIN